MLQLIWLSDQFKYIPNFMSRWAVLVHREYIKYKLFLRSQRGASSPFWGQECCLNLREHPGDAKHRDGWNTWSLSAFGKGFCLCSSYLCRKGGSFLRLQPRCCSCAPVAVLAADKVFDTRVIDNAAMLTKAWSQPYTPCTKEGFFFLSFFLPFFKIEHKVWRLV